VDTVPSPSDRTRTSIMAPRWNSETKRLAIILTPSPKPNQRPEPHHVHAVFQTQESNPSSRPGRTPLYVICLLQRISLQFWFILTSRRNEHPSRIASLARSPCLQCVAIGLRRSFPKILLLKEQCRSTSRCMVLYGAVWCCMRYERNGEVFRVL
jgi:hypothetical protein